MKSIAGLLSLAASLGLLFLGPTMQPFMQNLHSQQEHEKVCPNCSSHECEDPPDPSFFSFPATRHNDHDHHNCAFCAGLKNFQPFTSYSLCSWTSEIRVTPATPGVPVVSHLTITLTKTARAPPHTLFSA
ncbi:MAG: hypothetical protein KAR40_03890 [Candidatus Sabulitectum sp.]|nr:hypothetical protein [Candidatus Sabulitectum sp.]